jgi:NADH-quinone oxidoreductase subunit L
MKGDKRYNRFFAYLGIFTFSMNGIVLTHNLLMMYIFWELVGLSSYLLIGFWYEKKSASDAAKKASWLTESAIWECWREF